MKANKKKPARKAAKRAKVVRKRAATLAAELPIDDRPRSGNGADDRPRSDDPKDDRPRSGNGDDDRLRSDDPKDDRPHS